MGRQEGVKILNLSFRQRDCVTKSLWRSKRRGSLPSGGWQEGKDLHHQEGELSGCAPKGIAWWSAGRLWRSCTENWN